MKVFTELNQFPSLNFDLYVTIGNFDGVHLGHQAILNELKKKALENKGKSVVISFQNHPLEVLRPDLKIHTLCTQEKKIKFLAEISIDYLILLKFTKEFSEKTAEEFLKSVRENIPFSHLILGQDAKLGKNREGGPQVIQGISKNLGFTLEYFEDFLVDGVRISSSKIRQAIEIGDLQQAEKWLGHSYN